jgi:CrcB protein
MDLTSITAVALGGILGAWSRWGLGVLLNAIFPPIPFGTLAANLIGGYLVGFFLELFSERAEIPPEAQLFVVTGFLGALTTFSTFSAEATMLLARGQYIMAALHICGHLTGSIILTFAGIATCRRIFA